MMANMSVYYTHYSMITPGYYSNTTSSTGNLGNLSCEQYHASLDDIDPTTAMIQTYGPYFVGIFCAIAFLFGIIGNGTLLAIIIRQREMHQAPNIYLFSIALGDFMFILVYTPFTIFIYGLKDWPFNEVTCKFITFLQTFSVGLSIFTLTVLTCDRYIEVSKPLKIQTYRPSLRRNIMIASGAWIAAIAFATLDLLAAKLLVMHPCTKLVYCGTDWGNSYEKFRTLLDFTIFCSIPALVMLVLYIIMAHILLRDMHLSPEEYSPPLNQHNGYHDEYSPPLNQHHGYRGEYSPPLNQHNGYRGEYSPPLNQHNGYHDEYSPPLNQYNGFYKERKKHRGSRKKQQVTARKRTVVISVVLAVLFLLCLLPRQIFLFWYFFDESGIFNNFWYLFKIFGFMTTFVNSCINPIALCIVSQQWRDYYRNYLCCKMIKTQSTVRRN